MGGVPLVANKKVPRAHKIVGKQISCGRPFQRLVTGFMNKVLTLDAKLSLKHRKPSMRVNSCIKCLMSG